MRNRLDKYIFSPTRRIVYTTTIFSSGHSHFLSMSPFAFSYSFYLGISKTLRSPLPFNRSCSLYIVLLSSSRTACPTVFQSSYPTMSTTFFNNPSTQVRIGSFSSLSNLSFSCSHFQGFSVSITIHVSHLCVVTDCVLISCEYELVALRIHSCTTFEFEAELSDVLRP